jgi:hypothetical protein
VLALRSLNGVDVRRIDCISLAGGCEMLRVAIRRIRPEAEGRLRAWLAELNARAGEVRETFRDESVRAEQAYIVPGDSGPLLIYAVEAEDFEHASKAYATSHHKIDAEHRQVMRECLAESLNISPLYDVALETRG